MGSGPGPSAPQTHPQVSPTMPARIQPHAPSAAPCMWLGFGTFSLHLCHSFSLEWPLSTPTWSKLLRHLQEPSYVLSLLKSHQPCPNPPPPSSCIVAYNSQEETESRGEAVTEGSTEQPDVSPDKTLQMAQSPSHPARSAPFISTG